MIVADRRMRVLIVDDEPRIRELLDIVCREEGCDTRTAGSVPEALEHWRAWAPELVFLDLMMPGPPGTEFLRMVRGAGDATPVVIVSGEPRAAWIALANELGITAVVEKPFRLTDIVTLIRTAGA